MVLFNFECIYKNNFLECPFLSEFFLVFSVFIQILNTIDNN